MGGDSSACPCLPVCLYQTFTVSPSIVVAISWYLHVSLSLDCRVSVCCVCLCVCVCVCACVRARVRVWLRARVGGCLPYCSWDGMDRKATPNYNNYHNEPLTPTRTQLLQTTATTAKQFPGSARLAK